MLYIAGIDGGGNKTVCAVCDEEGTLLGYSKEGPSNLEVLGAEETQKILSESLQKALSRAKLELSQLSGICFGVGGLDTEEDYRAYTEITTNIVPSDVEIRIETDAFIGLHSGTFGGPGIAVVAGTFMLIAGMNKQGHQDRVGGWGHLFLDEGSAFYIGQKALIACLRAYDGRGPQTILNKLIVKELKIQSSIDIPSYFYKKTNPPREIAALAPIVDEAAERGDEIAIKILNDAGQELGLGISTLAKKLNMENEDQLQIVLIGGVFNSTLVQLSLKDYLKSQLEVKFKYIRPEWEPVVGSIVLALKNLNLELTPTVIENLKKIGKKPSKETNNVERSSYEKGNRRAS